MSYTNLYLWLLLLNFLQSSFPYNAQIFNITPNILLSFILAAISVLPLRTIWPIIIIAPLLLSFNSSISFSFLFFSFAVCSLIVLWINQKFENQYFVYLSFFVVFFTNQVLNLCFLLYRNSYSVEQILTYFLHISLFEVAMDFCLAVVFFWLIGYFVKKPNLSIQME